MRSSWTGRILLALAGSRRLEAFVRRHGKRLGVDRFVAGADLEAALAVVRELEARGFGTTVDRVGEGAREEAAADDAAAAYLELLDGIGRVGSRAHVSVKLTALGLDLDREACRGRVEAIAGRAKAAGSLVRVDMEDSAHLEPTLELLGEVRRTHPEVGVVVQAYLRRSREDLLGLIAQGVRIRLVKGAYREPPDIAYQRRDAVDRAYLDLARLALAAGAQVASATHDTALIAAIQREAAAMGRQREQVEFQMLYGVRPALQREVRDAGYPLRVYVPYGRDFYPYFMRRVAERPANLAFALRQLRDRAR